LRNFEENIILKEVTELVTGIRGTKSDDLTDEYLQAVARGEKPALP
jgi:hypothetical protein